jgi:CheY-like chemotaxis protein
MDGLMQQPDQARAAARFPAGTHVLVVDDDPGIRGFIEMMLRAEGYMVSTAANGQQGLDRALAHRPDVVLLDLAMPVMDGWQLFDRLQELDPTIPVICMTAGGSTRTEAEARGAAGYLAKPFEVDDLLHLITRFLDHHAAGC